MKIIAFGEVMMRLMTPDYKRLSQTDQLEFLFTGTGVNVLSGLYKMGHEPYLITCLPKNNVGEAACAHLRKLGIYDQYVCYKGDHIGIYFFEKGHGTIASEITYMNRSKSSFGQSIEKDYDYSCLDGKDVFHICGISLAVNENIRKLAIAFVKEAKKRHMTIVFDCNFRPTLWTDVSSLEITSYYEEILYLSDIVFAGYKDATLLLNLKANQNDSYDKQLEDVLLQMKAKYHIDVIFGTNRTIENSKDILQGFMVKDQHLVYSKKQELYVYDRIGGGDGFATGAIHGYLSQMEDQKLIDYATITGMMSHSTYGDSVIVSEEDVLDYMNNGKRDIKR